ncbi:propionyl-CoA synthetase [Cohaesibacter celericrescens]|uniref:Propionyl-CoA synthetase n=1 Tax=Cohaesibacter celericrescens TaxID=2067669 RepID=A0A2N5XL76_9HYPH|nr:propionyl-CoA synthetase [Cohaesibacter celericrescens]PLW75244.1 propionyl-CoA synthetase [Cohaesibacter celericrescens]
MSAEYRKVYEGWKQDPEGFWAAAAEKIDWFKPADKIFDADAGVYGRWFSGAECNTCFNALDRHVDAGRGDQAAIIYDSPITDSKETFSYADVKTQVQALAAVLVDRGVVKGDRVVIYMPMIPQAAFAMLACARIGAIHSVVFGGFAANELATRLNDAKPKAIISASCGIEPNRTIAYKPLLDEAMALATHKPSACIVYQREQLHCDLIEGRDVDYGAAVASAIAAGREVPCTPVLATDPLYILYTSGTTGQPKGVVRDNGGHMVALEWSMENVYDIKPGEVFWAASDVGWVVGHSYIVYAPLVHGATTLLFEGKPVGTPDAGTFWRVIAEHDVVALFTAPTAFRAIKKEDPEGTFIGKYDLSKLRTLFLAGERADPDTVQWAEDMLKVPVIDHWWQTETGWAIAANPVGIELLPVIHGSPTVAMPGYDVQIVGADGHQVGANEMGNIVIKLPMAPGNLPGLWQNDERFKTSYLEEFPGYYQTGDAGYMDENNYLYIMSRTDDIINVAGHRLSTGAMEEVLAGHSDVAECAVIGIADKLKGQLPAGFVVLKSGVDRPIIEIEQELVKLVRQKIGPVAAFKIAVTVDRLPKTRSGKILRGTMRAIADHQDYKMPATIDDPAILDEIELALREHGI